MRSGSLPVPATIAAEQFSASEIGFGEPGPHLARDAIGSFLKGFVGVKLPLGALTEGRSSRFVVAPNLPREWSERGGSMRSMNQLR